MTDEPYVVPVQAYVRRLAQEADQLEWDGQFQLADTRRKEMKVVQDYHEATGSVYYPMF